MCFSCGGNGHRARESADNRKRVNEKTRIKEKGKERGKHNLLEDAMSVSNTATRGNSVQQSLNDYKR